MKNYNFFFFIALFILPFLSQSQTNKYAIQTDQEDALKIHDEHLSKSYMLPVYIRSGGGCLIECHDGELLYLENIKNQEVNVKIFDIVSQKKT